MVHRLMMFRYEERNYLELKVTIMSIWEYIITVFLLIHGILHLYVGAAPNKDPSGNKIGWTGQSWLLNQFLPDKIIRSIGLILWGIATIGFISAGIGFLFQQEWWHPMASLSAATGIIVQTLTWKDLKPKPMHYIQGLILNAAIIIVLLIV